MTLHGFHTFSSLILASVVIILSFVMLTHLYLLAIKTIDKTARKTLTLVAHIIFGFIIVEIGILVDRIDDVFSKHYHSSHTELMLSNIGLIWVAWFSYSLVKTFREGALEHMTGIFKEIRELRRDIAVDKLTGLLNRNAMAKIAARQFEGSVIFIDIDDFKHYNDTYGHAAGDTVLKLTSEQIRNSIRNDDLAFRYGGEEFLVICPDTSLDECLFIAERIRNNISNIKEASITTSLGIAACGESVDLQLAIKDADCALYEAKKQGKNCVRQFNRLPSANISV